MKIEFQKHWLSISQRLRGGSIENDPLSEEKKEEKEASKQEDTAKSVDTNEAKSSPVRGINC